MKAPPSTKAAASGIELVLLKRGSQARVVEAPEAAASWAGTAVLKACEPNSGVSAVAERDISLELAPVASSASASGELAFEVQVSESMLGLEALRQLLLTRWYAVSATKRIAATAVCGSWKGSGGASSGQKTRRMGAVKPRMVAGKRSVEVMCRWTGRPHRSKTNERADQMLETMKKKRMSGSKCVSSHAQDQRWPLLDSEAPELAVPDVATPEPALRRSGTGNRDPDTEASMSELRPGPPAFVRE